MKTLLKILAVLAVIIIGFVVYVNIAWGKAHEAPYPDIHASTDPAMIERGRYLAYGPAHCATCHMPMDKIMDVENGLEVLPLSGGWEITFPLGTFHAPNLTPDEETGIGTWSDAQLARALRYSVAHDGAILMEFMPFQELSDEDLTAVISFLRSQPPVKHEVPRSEYSFLGKAIFTAMGYEPLGPKNTPLARVQRDSTAEYGRYLAQSVANCGGCHTERDLTTGEYIGKDFAGGMFFVPDEFSDGHGHMSPNITPDAETGVMAHWDEETFIRRFKAGRLVPGTPMPWGAFSRMDTIDLKALYRYLHGLEPVNRPVEKTIYRPGEEMPG
ncbi:MAG: c-type cytochrome [Flavobacteriales bacterium]|nr:c-type cytochrome [Flavobacteriales bacterium]